MATHPPTPRPVSAQRYFVRRVAVGVAIGVLLILLGSLVGRVLGGGDGSPDRIGPGAPTDPAAARPVTDPTDQRSTDQSSTGGVDEGAVTAGGGVDEGALAAGVEAAGAVADEVAAVDDGAAAAPTDRRVPTVDDPARVLIMGDSGGGTFGPYLERLLGQTGVVASQLEYKVSSGLARPDFYDWHAALAEKVPAFDPDIVVITFGGNDGQFLADSSGRSVVGQARPDSDNAEWTAEYRARVRRVVEYLLDRPGLTLVWVGIPNHADPDVRFRMQVQDQAVKAELAEWPQVRFVDAWTRFEGRNGGFAQFVIDPRDGVGKSVRASDGFHLNQTGAEILAIDIAGVVFDELRERGADL